MDLDTITSAVTPREWGACPAWAKGDAWLAGGTWLFSEPQPHLSRLIDLSALGWDELHVSDAGLRIGATCTIAALDRLELPKAWYAAPLVGQCCRALLGSFKIWNMASVGGNLCMALPAGPMISLASALEATCLVWAQGGRERVLPVADFVLGPLRNALQPGEVLRRIDIPARALARRNAFRRISLSPNGRSGALLIGTCDDAGRFALTLTASVPRPLRVPFEAMPEAEAMHAAIAAAVAADGWYDDLHGAPDWRAHVTHHLADEIRAELAA